MKLYSLLLLGAVLPMRVEAQAVAPKEPTNVDVWLSAGVGSGAIDGEQGLASSLALWVSGRHVLVGLRSGGIGHFPNDGGSTTNGNDVALLAGFERYRPLTPGGGSVAA